MIAGRCGANRRFGAAFHFLPGPDRRASESSKFSKTGALRRLRPPA
jgi:hypothetical protein